MIGAYNKTIFFKETKFMRYPAPNLMLTRTCFFIPLGHQVYIKYTKSMENKTLSDLTNVVFNNDIFPGI